MVKRAIALGGGGPAAGLHIGVLEALADADITFDVWALSCIGAWVGIVYNQFDHVANKDRAEKTYQFFKNGVFRDDEGYRRFPINTVFGPDWESIGKAVTNFVTDPNTYKDLWSPSSIMNAYRESMSLWFAQQPDTDGGKKFTNLDRGDVNGWILNQVLAPNPFVRYLTSMMYLSHVTGLSRINYPHSQFMKSINFEALKKPGTPCIFHNAWNLDAHKLALFSNRPMTQKADEKEYKGPISASSLCACSALPFVEETVRIDGVTYCEGALVDTVNFESLLEEHHKPDDPLHEIWVSRIVDAKQVRKPQNLHDALANLCQLFAATVGEDDVRLFKYHVRYDPPKPGDKKWEGTVVEIRVPGHISFKWNHSNLDMGRKLGKAATEQAIKAYNKHKGLSEHAGPHFINEDPKKNDPQGWGEVLDTYHDCQKRAA
ncbi:patatin-like phospholipase family protein [Bradyrhizobium sp. Arg237L]|uniref:patatin-like phospholipase family protein n=1 Tax=Bradyrhizobium sp. Arg237L TaxID=3003352 RepID=UPI00249DDB97|nr:patatin-like phospholipase family protein [Bradyrhizobium sp. Arg237L]MDI4237356.1 patatin-like phospholipase family protein [Bradyrhizobium sp. Arg237L]